MYKHNFEYYSYEQKRIVHYKRINKIEARKRYNKGERIIVKSCNCNPLVNSYIINNTNGQKFDTIINAYTYYNCNSETGRYASFYCEVN